MINRKAHRNEQWSVNIKSLQGNIYLKCHNETYYLYFKDLFFSLFDFYTFVLGCMRFFVPLQCVFSFFWGLKCSSLWKWRACFKLSDVGPSIKPMSSKTALHSLHFCDISLSSDCTWSHNTQYNEMKRANFNIFEKPIQIIKMEQTRKNPYIILISHIEMYLCEKVC